MSPILRIPAGLRAFALTGALFAAACGSPEPSEADEPCSTDTSCGTGQYCADGTCIVAPEAPAVPTIAAPDAITAGSRGVTASIDVPQAGIAYAWTISGGAITSGPEGDAVTFDVGDGPEVTLTVEGTNVRGQAKSGSRTIAVAPVGSATISAPEVVTALRSGIVASVPAQPGASFAWEIAGGAFTDGADTDTVTFTAGEAGTLTLGVTSTNAAGDSTTGTASIETVPAPSADITTVVGPVTTGTAGLVASVAAQAQSSFDWTVTGGTITTGQGTGSVTLTAGEVGTLAISVAVTNAAGDAATGDAAIPVIPAPVSNITAPAYATAGTTDHTAYVSGQPDSTYLWTVTNGTITAGQGTESITFAAGETGTALLSATVTNAAGDTNTSAASVEVVSPPLATITTMSGPVTAGKAGHVASVPPQASSTFEWAVTGGTITAGQGTESITFESGTVGALRIAVSVTNAAGIAATGETTVTVVPAPVATISVPTTITEGTAGLVASVPVQADSTFAWTVNNGTITAGQGTESIAVTAGEPGPVLLSLTVANPAGDTAVGQATVEAVPTPVATLTTVIGPITTGKAGFVASVPAQPGSHYAWAIAGGTITAGQATESVTFTAGAVGTLALSVTVTNAASDAATGETTLDVIAAPDAQVTAPSTVTAGKTGLLASVAPQPNSTFTWTLTNATIDAGQGSESITFTAGSSGTIDLSVTVTNAAGDEATDQRTITVIPAPDPTLTASSGPFTAGAADLTASVPPQSNVTYSWTVSGGTLVSGQGSPSISYSAGGPGSLQVSVVVTNAEGDSASESSTVRVVAQPNATVTGPEFATAGTASLIASVPAEADSTFLWTVAGGTLTAGQGTNQITFTAGAVGQLALSVSVTNAASDRADGSRSVTVVPAPVATVSAPSGPVTRGTGGLVASVPSQPGATYSWVVSNGTITAGRDTSQVVFTAGSPGQTQLQCTVTNSAGDQVTQMAALSVVAPPNVNISTVSPVIAGKGGYTASVPGQVGATYDWTVTGGTITYGAGTSLIAYTADDTAGTLMLEVVVTNAAGDGAAGSRNVSVVWGYFAQTGNMIEPRRYAKAVTLTNGRVLVTGGQGMYSNALRSAELYWAPSGTFSGVSAMSTERFSHSMTLLNDGKVLIAGGAVSSSTVHSSAELYDRATNSWTPTGSMAVPRYGHTSTLLADGRVLVAGGKQVSSSATSSAEIYDPATGTWSTTGSLATGRGDHSAVLLPAGRVLVAGGSSSAFGTVGTAEIYNPVTGTWRPAGSTITAHDNGTAVRLSDGKVLLAGGNPGFLANSPAAELYDPASGLFSWAAAMRTARSGHQAALLGNGRVLQAGGFQHASQNGSHYYKSLDNAEMYDPTTGTYLPTLNMTVQRAWATSAVLQDGRVLLMGGRTSTTTSPVQYETTAAAEIFIY